MGSKEETGGGGRKNFAGEGGGILGAAVEFGRSGRDFRKFCAKVEFGRRGMSENSAGAKNFSRQMKFIKKGREGLEGDQKFWKLHKIFSFD